MVEKIGSAPPPIATEQVAVNRQTCMTVVEEIDSAPPSFAAGDSVIIKTGEYEGLFARWWNLVRFYTYDPLKAG